MATLSKSAIRAPIAQPRHDSGLLHRIFLEHPHEAGETYGQHLGFTARVACYLLLTALIIVIHGLVPSLFDRTGSTRIARLHARFAKRNSSQTE